MAPSRLTAPASEEHRMKGDALGNPAFVPAERARPAAKCLPDQVYEHIKERLYVDLKPGARIIESTVADALSVSRTPVREGLKRLVQEGYLLAHLRNGYTVAKVDFSVINELYQVRTLLEAESLRQFCVDGEAERLAPLARVWLVNPSERFRETSVVARLNTEFHAELARLGGNRELARVHAEVFDRIRILQRLDFTRDERIDATYSEHGAIVDALRAKDGARTVRLLREHIGRSRDTVEEIVLDKETQRRDLVPL
jgi:DNA-binding GntR family transcriptional regulator